MRKLMFALLALAISLFGTQCWATTCSHTSSEVPVSCTNTFSPTGDNTGTYFFGANGALVITFPVVLTTFTLTATVNTVPLPFDPDEFPVGTVEVTYCNGQQDRYDFTGTGGSGMNGLPLKGTDFQGLIHIQLSYCTNQTVHTPAFAHAPDGSTTFTENFLGFYSTLTAPTFPPDPTMDGDTPGLCCIAAADEPLSGTATFCSLTTTVTNVPSGQKPQIEVTYKIVSGSDCSGTGLRDKTAHLFVARESGGFSIPALDKVEGNKFHWDNKTGLNEFDFPTDGLVSGQIYEVTVISELVSPPSVDFQAP